jgi:predicted permease
LQPLLVRSHELAGEDGSEYRRKVIESERIHVSRAAQGTGQGRAQYAKSLLALAGITGAVLLIACLNIAMLLLARASVREREFSVRLAIGASRGRVIRQLFTESLMLAFGGAALGLVFAAGFGQLLLNMVVSDRFHSTFDASLNTEALGFNFLIALLAGLIFGFAPAWQASRLGVSLRINECVRITRLTGRQVMISAQVALAVVVLAGAGLFLRTLRELRAMDLGFQPQRVLQAGIDPSGYSPEQCVELFRRVAQEIAAIPGVQAVSAGHMRVISGGGWGSGMRIQGMTLPESDEGPHRDVVGARYFSTLGIALVSGREFNDADLAPNAPKVAIINEAFAKFYFGDRNPLGMRIGPAASTEPEHTIVGVAKDSKYTGLREKSLRFWYAPFTQTQNGPARSLTFYARTGLDPDSLIVPLRSRIAAIDRGIALFDVKTIEEQFDDELQLERLLSTLSVLFGVLAAFLAAIGLFGVLSYSVARREREIGIRIALGAVPFRAAWPVVRHTALYVVAGIGLGLAGAMFVTQSLEKLLFGVMPGDPVAIGGACLLMLVAAVLAAFFPARKAASVEPAVTLRSE